MLTREEKWVLEEKYGGKETPEFTEDRHRLALGEPAAYVIGSQPFLGLKIYLDSRPLIPRPETEWWTELFLDHIRKRAAPQTSAPIFLDLCAGSGAIGCAALRALPDAKVYFAEISPAHETTIRKNIRENGLDEARADVRTGDLFAPFGDLQFDFIAANPPYLPETRALPESVAAYEPHEALFAGEDGLAVVRRIIAELTRRLKKGGEAWLECDSAHTEAARALCAAQNLSAQVRTDQYGVPRVLVVSFP